MEKGDDFSRLVAYVEERTVLEERLQKMEAFRGSIKELIFRRVQRDYSTRLATIRDQFRPQMVETVKKLKQVELEKDKLGEKIDESNDLLTELRFRNEIGEFDETMFREQEDALLLRLEELSSESDGLRHLIADYMFYLHDDKDFRAMASAEKLLERLEEDFKADRALAAEAEQARWQVQKQPTYPPAPAAPMAAASGPLLPPASPPRLAAVPPPLAIAARASAPIEEEVLEDDNAGFLQAFGGLESEDTGPPMTPPYAAPLQQTQPLGPPAPAQPSLPREVPPPPRMAPPQPAQTAGGRPQPPPPPQRVPAAQTGTDPRLKSKVIRRAPNSGG